MTTDIDAVVRGDAITAAKLVKHLARQHIEPRIPDAISFAQTNLVPLVRHQPTQVDLDLSFAWTAFELEAIAAHATGHFGEIAVPSARAEDLMIYKALAGRPKDLQDVSALLALHPGADLARVHQRVAELTEIADAPDLLTQLDELIRATRQAPPRSPPTKPPRPPSRKAPSKRRSPPRSK